MQYSFTILMVLLIVSCECGSDKHKDIPSDIRQVAMNPEVKQTVNVKSDSLYSVALVDNRSRRVFVVVDSAIAVDIKKVRVIVRQIKDSYKFDGKINISFISDRKYAGYKDELEMTAGISYWEFYNHYLGEYTQQTREYWTFPALPDKKEKYQID